MHTWRVYSGLTLKGLIIWLRSTRDGDTGNEDNSSFAWFFKLDKYAMFSFAMTSGLASDSDKFKIINKFKIDMHTWRVYSGLTSKGLLI